MPKDLNICLLLDYYGKMLTQKQYEVMDYYYNEDLSLAEISEHTHITRQGVRDSIKRGEAILTEAEERLGFVGRFSAFQRERMEIARLVSELQELNTRRIFSTELGEKLKQMRDILDRTEAEEVEESL
jgi:predicted DNA-binding protein YlxM (UPF0122 family)